MLETLIILIGFSSLAAIVAIIYWQHKEIESLKEERLALIKLTHQIVTDYINSEKPNNVVPIRPNPYNKVY